MVDGLWPAISTNRIILISIREKSRFQNLEAAFKFNLMSKHLSILDFNHFESSNPNPSSDNDLIYKDHSHQDRYKQIVLELTQST